eukprot:CAMPEP_0175104716 /NCGR_PEP_ID=MMETSP0086_2-20121207/9929_1 /TAXON_ID=136419 /ORGANISM="Unknown Unknown, Strain D1" /LENGTH=140 /DNA_ID=CAMNT_0016380233 /DNA_START=44 /DNA_END=466 /DNA_ORIENTATION=+
MSSKLSEEEKDKMQGIITTFKALRNQVQQLASKLTELDADRSEHNLVITAIKDLDPNRRCYRSIGGVLVERKVSEVLPAVKQNLEGITQVMAKLSETLKQKEKEAEDFRVLHNIGMVGSEDGEDEQKQSSAKEGGNGVLV